jgi:hypothetical protein
MSFFLVKFYFHYYSIFGQVLFSLLNYSHLLNWFQALLNTNVKLICFFLGQLHYLTIFTFSNWLRLFLIQTLSSHVFFLFYFWSSSVFIIKLLSPFQWLVYGVKFYFHFLTIFTFSNWFWLFLIQTLSSHVIFKNFFWSIFIFIIKQFSTFQLFVYGVKFFFY